MGEWDTIRQKIKEVDKTLSTSTWNSDRAGLNRIFDFAEKHGVKPPEASEFKLSRFREIINKAKQAVAKEDIEQFEKFIELASGSTVAQLRVKLGKKTRTNLLVREDPLNKLTPYTLLLSSGEFERIKKSTAAFFDFQVEQL